MVFAKPTEMSGAQAHGECAAMPLNMVHSGMSAAVAPSLELFILWCLLSSFQQRSGTVGKITLRSHEVAIVLKVGL